LKWPRLYDGAFFLFRAVIEGYLYRIGNIFAVLLIGMKKLNSHRIGVDSGTAHVFSDFADNGEMWSAEGKRSRSVKIAFSEPFLTPPTVQVGFAMWDISSTTNSRVDISAEDIDETGFSVVFRTWGDTKVARMRANWMAIGEVENDEVWDV